MDRWKACRGNCPGRRLDLLLFDVLEHCSVDLPLRGGMIRLCSISKRGEVQVLEQKGRFFSFYLSRPTRSSGLGVDPQCGLSMLEHESSDDRSVLRAYRRWSTITG